MKKRNFAFGKKSTDTSEELLNHKKSVLTSLRGKSYQEGNFIKPSEVMELDSDYNAENNFNRNNHQFLRKKRKNFDNNGSKEGFKVQFTREDSQPSEIIQLDENGEIIGINKQLEEDGQIEEMKGIVTFSSVDKQKLADKLNIDLDIDNSPQEIKDEIAQKSHKKKRQKENSEELIRPHFGKKANPDVFNQDTIKIPVVVEFQASVETKGGSESGNNHEGKVDDFPENLYPWVTHASRSLRGMLKLHQEIIEFYQYMKPTPEEDELRERTFQKVKEIILSSWPNWKVKTFGSFPNKIHLPDSDIDIVVIADKSQDLKKLLKKIGNKLINSLSYINIINARVPIIRATVKETNINVDISVNRKNGYQAKKIIKKVLEEFPFIRPLMYVLKYFLRQRNLNETFTGGISSFLLFNLVYSYIQFLKKEDDLSQLTLGHILVGFFQFYAFEFNYDQVGISIRYGGYFYKKNERLWNQQTRTRNLLSVENFQELDQDIGKGAFKINKVLDSFKQARDALYYPSAYPIESFLGQFIHVDSLIKERYQKKLQEKTGDNDSKCGSWGEEKADERKIE